MAAAVCTMKYNYGATPTVVAAESGLKFNKEDTQSGTTPVPIPTATGTNYSWYKMCHLNVDTAGTTNITNRKVYMGSSPTTGLYLFFKDGGATYTQATDGNRPADVGTGPGTLPAGYTAMTTSALGWDATQVATSSTGRNGNYVTLLFGVSDNYAGGAGSAIALPDLKFQYDEA